MCGLFSYGVVIKSLTMPILCMRNYSNFNLESVNACFFRCAGQRKESQVCALTRYMFVIS